MGTYIIYEVYVKLCQSHYLEDKTEWRMDSMERMGSMERMDRMDSMERWPSG